MGRGFTLIEVLIAMLVLAISFLWLLKAETQGIDMSVRSKFITTSTLLAQERIAKITSGEETVTTGSDQATMLSDPRDPKSPRLGKVAHPCVAPAG